MPIPRILIVDDLYGAQGTSRGNRDRYDFCYRLKLTDITGDERDAGAPQQIDNPIAEAVFCRGQSNVAGVVHNDEQIVLRMLREGWKRSRHWALVLLDLHFATGKVGPDGYPVGTRSDRDPDRYFGIALLEEIKQEVPDVPVVVLSAMEREQVEVRLSKGLADDFLAKDTASAPDLRRLLEYHGLIEDPRALIRGASVPLLKALRAARRAARTGNENVLILGEQGTGKELLAHYIHDMSPRRDGPCVSLYLHGYSETLLESELFGYEKGAFTDAKVPKAGAAEQADRGTLFIDEFHDIPLRVQSKLLRLLDRSTREVQRAGNVKPRRVELQALIATNDLKIHESEQYRADLRSRVEAVEIMLPALRERIDEIPTFAEHFVRKAEEALVRAGEKAERGRTIDADAIAELQRHSWPGNVREVDDVVRGIVRDYPGLRIISGSHVRRALARQHGRASDRRPESSDVGGAAPIPGAETLLPTKSLEALLADLDACRFASEYDALYGKLPLIQAAFARLLARYLKAGLLFMREPVAGKPEGRINITGALKCLTASDLTTLQAADLLRRALKSSPEVLAEATQDAVLGPILAYAARRRQTTSKARSKGKSADS